jgi:hypothetical protein
MTWVIPVPDATLWAAGEPCPAKKITLEPYIADLKVVLVHVDPYS